jgi:hypothetical protein
MQAQTGSKARSERGSWIVVLAASAILTVAAKSCPRSVEVSAAAGANGHACAIALHVASHARELDARCM